MSAPRESVHRKLMQDMGSPNADWNPIGPRMHKSLKDRRERIALRVWGVLLDCTIDPAEDDKRSAIARQPDGQKVYPGYIAAVLQMSLSLVSRALDQLEEEGKIERRPGQIRVRADMPLPVIAPETKSEEEANLLNSTELPLSQEEEAFLVQMQRDAPEKFTAAISRVLALQLWDEQVKAQAISRARLEVSTAREQLFTELGYNGTGKRGRPKKEAKSETLAEFTVRNARRLEALAKGICVLNDKLVPYKAKTDSEQNAHPYATESESEFQLANGPRTVELPSSPDAETTPAQAPKTRKEAAEAQAQLESRRAELKAEIQSRLHRARFTSMGASKVDPGTLTTLTNHLLLLPTVRDIREVLDTLEERARELATGKKRTEKEPIAYLVGVVKSAVENRLPKVDLKAAAAGMGIR